MNQYIIDEETWLRVEYFLRYLYELNDSTCDKEWIDNIISIIRSNPYNPQAERKEVLDDIETVIDKTTSYVSRYELERKIAEHRQSKDGEL